MESLYHWRGKIETAQEIPVVVKTCPERYPEVEAAIRAGHPYELPEIVAVPVTHGLAPYLQWIADETASVTPRRTALRLAAIWPWAARRGA